MPESDDAWLLLLRGKARAILHPGLHGGGSGAGFVNGGGGSFTVLAMGGIVNAAGASILAAGSRASAPTMSAEAAVAAS